MISYQKIIEQVEAAGYKVADGRITKAMLRTWELPYCEINRGQESTRGADLKPLLRVQPAVLTLYTTSLDAAEQAKVKAVLDAAFAAYQMQGEYIEDGAVYASDFTFNTYERIK